MEEWRPIPGVPLYEASSLGRIRRVSHRILKPDVGTRRRDYPRVQIPVGNGRFRKTPVHVLVARAFIGECPNGYEHNHRDGNKLNACPDNLEFVTHSTNERHKFRELGVRINQGSKHAMAILNETDVVSIRAQRAAGVPLSTLAKAFRVSVSTVSMICAGKTWRHLL